MMIDMCLKATRTRTYLFKYHTYLLTSSASSHTHTHYTTQAHTKRHRDTTTLIKPTNEGKKIMKCLLILILTTFQTTLAFSPSFARRNGGSLNAKRGKGLDVPSSSGSNAKGIAGAGSGGELMYSSETGGCRK